MDVFPSSVLDYFDNDCEYCMWAILYSTLWPYRRFLVHGDVLAAHALKLPRGLLYIGSETSHNSVQVGTYLLLRQRFKRDSTHISFLLYSYFCAYIIILIIILLSCQCLLYVIIIYRNFNEYFQQTLLKKSNYGTDQYELCIDSMCGPSQIPSTQMTPDVRFVQNLF